MSEHPRRISARRRAASRRVTSPTTHVAAIAAGAVALVLSVGACASSPQLTASVDTMVELESSLQCDITRFAHPDAEAVEGYRDQVRDRFAVTAEDHKIFLDMLADDEVLRGQVADRADALCPPAADADVEES